MLATLDRRQFDFLRDLPNDQWAALSPLLRPIRLQEGSALFREGEPAGFMIFVSAGMLEVTQTNQTGERIFLEAIGPGTVVGEVALLAHGRRSADVLVTRDLVGWVLERPDLEAFLARSPATAMAMLEKLAQRVQASGEALRQTATRNEVEVLEATSTRVERLTDRIAAFSGSLRFVVVHALLYGGWITLNLALGKDGPDPFPFLLLAMAASTEAIFLSCFVLLSQNRQAAKDRIRAEIEYEVNLAAERQIQQLHRKLDTLTAEFRQSQS